MHESMLIQRCDYENTVTVTRMNGSLAVATNKNRGTPSEAPAEINACSAFTRGSMFKAGENCLTGLLDT